MSSYGPAGKLILGQGDEPNHRAIGLARLRLDGFVSIDAGEAAGTLTTQPLRFADPALYVNADASRGELRIEVLEEAGAPVSGFTAADCVPLERDAVRHRVGWRGAADLASLRGRTVREVPHTQC